MSRLPELGVDTVINLCTHMEMDNRGILPFDEAAVLGEAIAIARQLNFGDIPLEAFLDQPLRIDIADVGAEHD